MDRTQIQTFVLLIVWTIVGVAGVSFIRSAFRDHAGAKDSKLAAAVHEVRFRLRLAFGVILLFLVASGLYWMATNGGK